MEQQVDRDWLSEYCCCSDSRGFELVHGLPHELVGLRQLGCQLKQIAKAGVAKQFLGRSSDIFNFERFLALR